VINANYVVPYIKPSGRTAMWVGCYALLFLPPTGWGFMLIHGAGILGPMVVTDGGSIRPCYSETIDVLWNFLKRGVKPYDAWAWILSHIDYDHYSITGGFIRAGLWPKPKLVALSPRHSTITSPISRSITRPSIVPDLHLAIGLTPGPQAFYV